MACSGCVAWGRLEAQPWASFPWSLQQLFPNPLRWVRLLESLRTKPLCDFCFESGLWQRGGATGPGGWGCPQRGGVAEEENKIVSFFLVMLSCQSLPPPALRTAGFPNGSLGKRPSGSLGKRPSAPFRSNVYQPTEMAVVLNGGTVSIKMWCGGRKPRSLRCGGAASTVTYSSVEAAHVACKDRSSNACNAFFFFPFLPLVSTHGIPTSI